MFDALPSLRDGSADGDCDCSVESAASGVVLTADDCDGGGDLAASPACRATAVEALGDHGGDAVRTTDAGTARRYRDRSVALLAAAGRFAVRVAPHDDALAARARRDPLGAARAATGRAGRVADVVAETGLAEVAAAADGYDDAFRAFVGPTAGAAGVDPAPPPGASLEATRTLAAGATARVYAGDQELRTYHLEPVEAGFDDRTRATLAAARDRLAAGATDPHRAVTAVADAAADPVADLVDVLEKHTRGYGVLEDFFSDDAVSDVFVTAPVDATNCRVVADGETMRTNVRLTPTGARTLASRLRRESGRSFSPASPAIDALARDVGTADRVRAAGVTDPVSDGAGFAFRAHGRQTWTLPALVKNGTVPASAAALLSVAVERGAAVLLAGARGAGKTTALGTLLWELPAATRVVCIEDTAELPVAPLQERGRDVQRLRTEVGDRRGLSPTDALRTALRLGNGALVVGEVRGEEAAALYEAMRVGANDGAVLGTVHGDGADTVRERVVSDLGVPQTAFAATDLVVTVAARETPRGTDRGLAAVAEPDGDGFARLFEPGADGAVATGRLERGNSRVVADLSRPGESYRDVLDALEDRSDVLESLASAGRTGPDDVVDAHAARRGGA
ncbi:MAG: ATPase, T2SS/T4P/T4SS family [Halobacteriaceae archaeon]